MEAMPGLVVSLSGLNCKLLLSSSSSSSSSSSRRKSTKVCSYSIVKPLSSIAERPAKVVENPWIVRKEDVASPTPTPGDLYPESSRGDYPTKGTKFRMAMERARSAKNLQSAVCNFAEGLVSLIEPETRPGGTNPLMQLTGNFAPVSEECPPRSDLQVFGSIPACLNGVYIRNGPNPLRQPTGGYHMFDGDGMLHAVRIQDGIPSYCCRYTQTYRYKQEKAEKQSLFPLMLGEVVGLPGVARLGLLGLRYLLGVLKFSEGVGSTNAGLAFYNGRLLAMSEDDKPYAIHVTPKGDLMTLGRYDFGGDLNHLMTAHPKIDPQTGEFVAYYYDVLKAPHLGYFRASPKGKKSPTVYISMSEPSMMHDFGVTQRYVLFSDSQMVFRPGNMVSGKSPIVFDENKVARIGVLPKDDTDESRLKWFDCPGFCAHYLNAWEEGDEVVLLGSKIFPAAAMLDDPEIVECYLTEFCLNLDTGKSSQRAVTGPESMDNGTINLQFYGRKTRFAYMTLPGPWPKYGGIEKVDLEAKSPDESVVGHRKYSPGCFGSEPCFVPRNPDSLSPEDEDDGYIVTYMHDERTNISELVVYDARSPTFEPVASVILPARVPYGFHGIFLSESQLSSQNQLPLRHS